MIDFKKIRTIPITQRKNKVSIEDLADINRPIKILRTKKLKKLSQKIIQAYKNNKQVILMMGAHVIKTGMSPYIIDLMKKRVITHIAMNGAGSIHDFELAYLGATSEDVQTNIEDGTFGMAEETGMIIHHSLKNNGKLGYGESIGKTISESQFKYKDYSIQRIGYELDIPVTIHVAIGTDIIHQHPHCDGAVIGEKSYQDFKIFANSVSKLNEGVIINIGSAVIMPEVFLKALTIVRNLEYKVENFTSANLDMIDHYRPRENVVNRPTSLGGNGFFIKGMHERTIPTLYKHIKDSLR